MTVASETKTISEVPEIVKSMARPPRVMVTKTGLDVHDRGSRLVASFLRDAGMEVIYTGPWQQVATVVNQAAQEDVDCIAISSLAPGHLLVPKLMKALDKAGLSDLVVIVGGIVPDVEEAMLHEHGVAKVFPPGCSREEIVSDIAHLIAARRKELGDDA